MEAIYVNTNNNCIGIFACITINYWLRDFTKPIVKAPLKLMLFSHQIVQTVLNRYVSRGA